MNQLFPIDVTSPFWLRHFRSISFLSVTFVHLVVCGILYWSIRSREEVVILRYNAYLGIDLLGVWWQLFVIPAVSYFFVLTNLLLIELLRRRGYEKLAFLLVCGNWFLAGATVVATLALSFINV